MCREEEKVVPNWCDTGGALARHHWQFEIVWRVDAWVWMHLNRMREEPLSSPDYLYSDLKREQDYISWTPASCGNTCRN